VSGANLPRRIASERIYEGRRISLRKDTYDDEGVEFVREIVEHPGAAVLVPFLTDDELVLVRQHRPAVGRTLLELPAGTLEPDEDPALCAARELEEETGYRAGKIEPLGFVYPSPGVLGEVMHFFRARDLRPGERRPDPGEKIEVVRMSVGQALAGIRNGKITDGKTVVGLMLARELAG
jgi:ADP-ribose pyrophosphatase